MGGVKSRFADDAAYRSWEKKKRNNKHAGPIDPGPNDLTADKILQRMQAISVGDRIRFDSMLECFTSSQVDRHSSTIKAIGVVEEHHGGYLIVRLAGGLKESVNYFDIEAVNGMRWPWYIKKSSPWQSMEATADPQLVSEWK